MKKVYPDDVVPMQKKFEENIVSQKVFIEQIMTHIVLQSVHHWFMLVYKTKRAQQLPVMLRICQYSQGFW